MEKLKKNIITIIVFLFPLILLTLSVQGYWYKIHFSNGEIYLFRYSNIQISNITNTPSTPTPQPTITPKLFLHQNQIYQNNQNDQNNDDINSTKIQTENITYGKAVDTQDVFFVCLVCTIISLVCNLVILVLQLINIKVSSKHNLYLVNVICKMLSIIMISFNLGSTLYLLNFRSTFNKECQYLGNCLDNSNNAFIGDESQSSFTPWYSWFFNCISITFILTGIILLFLKNRKDKHNKYQLLV